MSKIIKLKGSITTVQPYTVKNRNEGTHFPLDTKGNPYIPASKIRGWLRHASHMALTECALSQNIYYDLATHYLMGNGVDIYKKMANLTSSRRSQFDWNLKKNYPFFSIFGLWLISSKLSVDCATSENELKLVKIDSGYRNDLLEYDSSIVKYINPEDIDDLDNLLMSRATSDEIKNDPIQKYINEIQEHEKRLKSKDIPNGMRGLIQRTIGNLENKIKGYKSQTSNLNNLNKKVKPFYAIDRDVSLNHSLQLNNPTDSDIEFLFWTLLVSSKVNLGAKVSLGCGKVIFAYDIYVQEMLSEYEVLIGQISVNEEGKFNLVKQDGIDLRDYSIGTDIFNINLIKQRVMDSCIKYGEVLTI